MIYGAWVNGWSDIWSVDSWMARYMARGLMDGVIHGVWVHKLNLYLSLGMKWCFLIIDQCLFCQYLPSY